MNSGWTYREQVNASAQGLTVLDYYTRHYRHSTGREWQQRIESGQILLDGTETTAETRLRLGQWLTYDRPPWQEPEVPLSVEIVYEDRELMVVAKPSGLPVLPGGGFLEHTLLWQLRQRYPQDTPYPIHRLGRGTSGLVLLARSPAARAYLSQQMRNHQIQKIYRALARGNGMGDCFTITDPIGKIFHPVLGYIYAANPQGSPAHSECHVLRREPEMTLLEVNILTGRPHQIRIHLAAAGYPLVGDPLYGVGGVPISCIRSDNGEVPVPGDCGYHLHAIRLSLSHPNGQPMSFMCSPPPELQV
ncbi:RluA family pseudouridine synthase [Kovacikia minuta CCNUW1]|uniref:RluA family pseudouridine synthase n=1 Tax=Kovacikia minuta TaxID=2931930 RepID=UPI001CCA87A3|nr:RluA family pseudouridine synthase [Kovacikia minuta]UBF26437.1 RluA family pseudouridine synthase [Kovacikia minuta CCNUW1]